MNVVYVDDFPEYSPVIRSACHVLEGWLGEKVAYSFITVGGEYGDPLWLLEGRECADADINRQLIGTRCVPSKAAIHNTLSTPNVVYLLDLEFHKDFLKSYGLDLALYLVSHGVFADHIVLFTAFDGRALERFKAELSRKGGRRTPSFYSYEKASFSGDPDAMGERLAWKLMELLHWQPVHGAAIGGDVDFPRDVVGASEKLRAVYRKCKQAAGSDHGVLLTGESGTGKDLFAKTIHSLSPRRQHPFVKVNSAALPENLLESELFGYEKGAFTDARAAKAGKIELADKGVLFLNEIGELTKTAQAKLLQVLEDKKVTHLGGVREKEVDFRLVCATNRNLRSMVEAGEFREDLFFRISVLEIDLPPLRERRDDILPLAMHFLRKDSNGRARSFSDAAARLLNSAEWRGNARELRNAVSRAAIESSDSVISADVVKTAIQAASLNRESGKTVAVATPWAQWEAVVRQLKDRSRLQSFMAAFSKMLRKVPVDATPADEATALVWRVLVVANQQMCERPEDVREMRSKGGYGHSIRKISSLLLSLDLDQGAKEALSDEIKHPLPDWRSFEYSGEANPRDWADEKKEPVRRVIRAMQGATRG